mmetsp:Transcript_65128/g.187420  ORF Transcript_65128/g.187420 Transcript_65128/m.187420 type:complete len:204 (+) Transcript_65128:245-856(+)
MPARAGHAGLLHEYPAGGGASGSDARLPARPPRREVHGYQAQLLGPDRLRDLRGRGRGVPPIGLCQGDRATLRRILAPAHQVPLGVVRGGSGLPPCALAAAAHPGEHVGRHVSDGPPLPPRALRREAVHLDLPGEGQPDAGDALPRAHVMRCYEDTCCSPRRRRMVQRATTFQETPRQCARRRLDWIPRRSPGPTRADAASHS